MAESASDSEEQQHLLPTSDHEEQDADELANVDPAHLRQIIAASSQRDLSFGDVQGGALDHLRAHVVEYFIVSVIYFGALIALGELYEDPLYEIGLPWNGRDLFPTVQVHSHHGWRYWRRHRHELEASGTLLRLVLHAVTLWVDYALLWYPLLAGFYYATFEAMRQPERGVRFGDFLYAYQRPRRLWRAAAVGTVFFASTLVFSLHYLFMIPYFVFQIVTLFVPMLLVEHPNLSLADLFVYSFKATATRNFGWLFVTFLIAILVQVAGVLCVLVGLLFTFPLALLMYGFAYHDLVGVRGCAFEHSMD